MKTEKYQKVRSAVCAVGYMNHSFSKVRKFDVARDFNIVGTGFLIDENKILTNRHVIQALKQLNSGETWTLQFFADYKNKEMLITQNLIGIEFPEISDATAVNSAVTDLGVLVPKAPFQHKRKPVNFADLKSLNIGKEVALCGYAGGNSFINFDNFKFTRAGPLTFFGRIAALAPWDFLNDPRSFTNILTDISNGGGFSGSPLFCPHTGLVIGIHYAGNQNYGLGIAHPLDRLRIEDIIISVNCALKGYIAGPGMSVLGDLNEEARSKCLEFLSQHQ